jgi:hypothetical protein
VDEANAEVTLTRSAGDVKKFKFDSMLGQSTTQAQVREDPVKGVFLQNNAIEAFLPLEGMPHDPDEDALSQYFLEQVSLHDNTLLQTGPLGNTPIRQALDQKTQTIATEAILPYTYLVLCVKQRMQSYMPRTNGDESGVVKSSSVRSIDLGHLPNAQRF